MFVEVETAEFDSREILDKAQIAKINSQEMFYIKIRENQFPRNFLPLTLSSGEYFVYVCRDGWCKVTLNRKIKGTH